MAGRGSYASRQARLLQQREEALAGLELTEQTLRGLGHRVAAGDVSADAAISAGVAHFDALLLSSPIALRA